MGQAGPRKRKKKKNPLYTPLSFIIICAALTFGMSVFFRISTIEVVGNNIYTQEEIIEASGLEKGDNLFFVNRFKAISRLFSKLPYVAEASIARSLPNKLIIEIEESRAIAYVVSSGDTWLIDRECKLLEKVRPAETGGMIKITGLSPISPSEGEIISPGEGESAKVSYLTELLKRIEARGMTGDIAEIDMSNLANPSFDYLGRFVVKMGKNENIDYKFELLLSSVSQLAEGDAGTIDLSIDKKAHFSPS
ncbi:MAG TPA: FtsQ-type POTRA domain-containing protein [Clostridiales bacterium]|nr:FtsQ-type POTRA domain-containing protein [Clostridiales bacterium]